MYHPGRKAPLTIIGFTREWIARADGELLLQTLNVAFGVARKLPTMTVSAVTRNMCIDEA